MEKVLQEESKQDVLTVENLNRMNDAFAKFIFANEERKQLLCGIEHEGFVTCPDQGFGNPFRGTAEADE